MKFYIKLCKKGLLFVKILGYAIGAEAISGTYFDISLVTNK